MELATKVAALQFENRDFVLMFRGQNVDLRNHAGNTTLKPRLLRHESDPKKIPDPAILAQRFAKLMAAEELLVHEYKLRRLRGIQRLERQRILRWSILQHYQICDTPLLDVSQSLRVAASFAAHEATDSAYIFVLGVPHISGAITASAEAGLQVVRLASVCPPSAVRPHIQEGYLLGEYPEFSSVEQKQLYKSYEVDFGRRLIAKFQFDPKKFWDRSATFPRIPRAALYPPSSHDPMCELAAAIAAGIDLKHEKPAQERRSKTLKVAKPSVSES
jgi:hypothetical protein